MKKKIISVLHNEYIDWAYGVSVKKMKEDLDSLEAKGVTTINIKYSYDCIDISAFIERIETDEEYQKRLKSEQEFAERKKASELETFLALKKKYEGIV